MAIRVGIIFIIVQGYEWTGRECVNRFIEEKAANAGKLKAH